MASSRGQSSQPQARRNSSLFSRVANAVTTRARGVANAIRNRATSIGRGRG